MEHQLTIAYGPNAGFQDQIRVMAQIGVNAFEDEGFPDSVSGKLLDLPEELFREVRSLPDVLVDLGGQPYRFTNLEDDGSFELQHFVINQRK